MNAHAEVIISPAHPFQRHFIPVRVSGRSCKFHQHLAVAALRGNDGCTLRCIGPPVDNPDLPGLRKYPAGIGIRCAGGDLIVPQAGKGDRAACIR